MKVNPKFVNAKLTTCKCGCGKKKSHEESSADNLDKLKDILSKMTVTKPAGGNVYSSVPKKTPITTFKL